MKVAPTGEMEEDEEVVMGSMTDSETSRTSVLSAAERSLPEARLMRVRAMKPHCKLTSTSTSTEPGRMDLRMTASPGMQRKLERWVSSSGVE